MRTRTWLPAALTLIPLAALAQSVTPAGDAEIVVINQSSWSIHQLYLSSTTDSNWGEDRLGTQTLPPGSKFTLTGIACDTYDVRVVDQDGDQCVVNNVTMCGDQTTWNLTNDVLLSCQAETRARQGGSAGTVTPSTSTSTVTITNQTLWSINQFYISASTDTNWGPDQLGARIIPPSSNFTLEDIPCGEYDLKIVDEDGDACVVPKVTLCGTNASWNLTNEVLLGCQGYGQ